MTPPNTSNHVYEVLELPEFTAWLDSLKQTNPKVHARLLTRLRRAQLGNLGDHKSVGRGVCEMRDHSGCGWRMYYIKRGSTLIIMLGGGEKSTQQQDIAKAYELAEGIED